MRFNPVRDGRSFAVGTVLMLVVSIAVAVGLAHLRDRSASTRCQEADARMSLGTSAGGGFIATVTVYDDRRRNWELTGDEDTGSGAIPLAEMDAGPDFRGIIVPVSDTDDGYTKVLRVRPVGEPDWCALKARIGWGF